ncbi:MAG: AI-2E family transporter [Patescibacteria group bacterium]|nr:AI-2E family transporter [Patescibacteria group bacterium]
MKKNWDTIFLVAFLALVGLSAFEIMRPYLVVLLLAFIFSRFFGKYYSWLVKKLGGRRAWAAAGVCVMVFILLVVPLVIIVNMIINEAAQFIQLIGASNLEEKLNDFPQNRFLRDLNLDLETIIKSKEFLGSVKSAGNLLVGALKSTYKGAAHFIFMIFVMFFALYYFLKDGDRFIKRLMELSPLKDKQEQVLLHDFMAISKATLKGSLVIAIIQGFLTGLVLWLTGVPSAAFLGLVATIFAFLPVVGTSFVWAPAGVIMLVLGNVWQGLVIILFGIFVVSIIDNFLRPRLVGNESSLHPLLVFLSTLGGLALFGIAGFIIGPVVIVLFLSLLKIYQKEFKEELRKFNKN